MAASSPPTSPKCRLQRAMPRCSTAPARWAARSISSPASRPARSKAKCAVRSILIAAPIMRATPPMAASAPRMTTGMRTSRSRAIFRIIGNCRAATPRLQIQRKMGVSAISPAPRIGGSTSRPDSPPMPPMNMRSAMQGRKARRTLRSTSPMAYRRSATGHGPIGTSTVSTSFRPPRSASARR